MKDIFKWLEKHDARARAARGGAASALRPAVDLGREHDRVPRKPMSEFMVNNEWCAKIGEAARKIKCLPNPPGFDDNFSVIPEKEDEIVDFGDGAGEDNDEEDRNAQTDEDQDEDREEDESRRGTSESGRSD